MKIITITVPNEPMFGKRSVQDMNSVLRKMEARKLKGINILFKAESRTLLHLSNMDITSGFFKVSGRTWYVKISDGGVFITPGYDKVEKYFKLWPNEHLDIFIEPKENKAVITFQFLNYDEVPSPYARLIEPIDLKGEVGLSFSVSKDFFGSLGNACVPSHK